MKLRLAMLAAGATLVAACASPARVAPGTIVVALANAPTNLDPGIGTDEASQKLHQLLFSSLVKIDERLRVVPDLATRFETTDYQNYTVAIPPGVHFHDGREMTSADVAFTFRRFLDPAFTSARKGAYRSIGTIDEVDRYTVTFHLKQPNGSFPINLVMGIVPVGTGASAGRKPVGSGPYRLVEFLPDDHVTLAAFDDYYQSPPANRGLLFKVVPDETMRALELRKGDVDLVVNDISPDAVHTLRETGRFDVATAPGTDYAYIGINMRDPLLKDRRVRQAIGYAVDTDAIVKYLRRDLARPAIGLVPDMSWAFAADAFHFTHDPAKARALLDEACFPDPDGDGPAPRLHLTLKTSTAEPYRVQATLIQQQLADVGIALDLRSYELATLISDIVRGSVQLYTLQYVGITDPDMLRRAFYSTQIPPDGFNRGHYANPEVDKLIDQASGSLNEDDRRRYYADAQRLIAIDAPYISLWARTNVAVSPKGLTGVSLSPIADFTFLKNVTRTSQ